MFSMFVAALAGCGDSVIRPSDETSSDAQGVFGIVSKTVGSPEPSPGGPTTDTFPLSVPVLAVRGEVPIVSATGFAHVPDHEALDVADDVRSSDDGTYEIHLPTGTFTLLALIEGDYAVPCHHDGVACSYHVERGEFVEVDIDRAYP